MMKFTLLYLCVLSIILVFNYGAHSEERMENELEENEMNHPNILKANRLLDEHDENSYSGTVTPDTV